MREKIKSNVVLHEAAVTRALRERQNGHRAFVIWLTGLSGAGKSTIAHAVEEVLHKRDCRTFVLDGDNVRHGLCSDLGFSPQDRTENLRRVGEVSRLFIEAGVIALTAFISPLRADREHVRQIAGPENFFEVFIHCRLEVCEARDVKGMYRRARTGEIKEFTGISAPYEPPQTPALVVDTTRSDLAQSVAEVMSLVDHLLGP